MRHSLHQSFLHAVFGCAVRSTPSKNVHETTSYIARAARAYRMVKTKDYVLVHPHST